MYRCLFSLVYGALGIITASVVLPDYNKAAISLERIFNILESDYEIDASKKKGLTPEKL